MFICHLSNVRTAGRRWGIVRAHWGRQEVVNSPAETLCSGGQKINEVIEAQAGSLERAIAEASSVAIPMKNLL